MALNTYASLEELKAIADSPPPQSDDVLLDWLEDISRAADKLCDRDFFLSIATRRFDPPRRGKVSIDDLLSVFELKVDTDNDQVPDQVVPSTNYLLNPYNTFPKISLIIGLIDPVLIFSGTRRAIQLDAVWGYGSGDSATPWVEVVGETVTVADATTTTITVVASTLYEIGATYRVAGLSPNRDEYFYVEAKPGATSLTVQRAVNGSTGAAHAGVSVYRIQIHSAIKNAVVKAVVRRVETEGSSTSESEKIGSYSSKSANLSAQSEFEDAFTKEESARLGKFKRYRGPGI